MRITSIQARREAGGGTLEAEVRPDAGGSFDLFFRIDGTQRAPVELGDAFAVGMLVACMHEGEDLHIEAPVSATLLSNMVHAQDVLTAWWDNLQRVEVHAPTYEGPHFAAPASGVGCCFTSGIDSLYTLRKRFDEVTHLFLARGFDVPMKPKADPVWNMILEKIRAAAAALDRPLITVETNLRELADKQRAPWGKPHPKDFWGSRLSSSSISAAALTLQGDLGRLYMPASYAYQHLFPWSSHPLIDPHWSTADLGVVHDGNEATRLQKVEAISDWEEALPYLRVCYLNLDGHYNCGICEKCLRTLVGLRLQGVTGGLDAFDEPLSLRRVRRLILSPSSMVFWRPMHAAAVETGDAPLAQAIAEAMNKRMVPRRVLRLVRHRVGSMLPEPLARRAARLPIG